MNKLFTYLALIFIVSGYTSTTKVPEITLNQYLKEIPFNFDYGLPIIKATINDKEYNFLFDTGMPNTLSSNLTKELNLKKIRSTWCPV